MWTLIALVVLALALAVAGGALRRLVSPAPLAGGAQATLVVGVLVAAIVALGTAIAISTHTFCSLLGCQPVKGVEETTIDRQARPAEGLAPTKGAAGSPAAAPRP